MLDNVNLNLLRSLHILLEECHVSQAAKRLNITQSAMSRQLSQLRLLFSDPLLIREGNRLYPTPKAQYLQTKMADLFNEFAQLLEDDKFIAHEWDGKFTFASSDYVAQYIYPHLVETILSIAPNSRFEFKMWQPEMINALATSQLNLASAMLPEAPAGLSSVLLGQDRPVVVMKHNHCLAGKEKLTIEELLCYSHIVVTGGSDKDISVDKELASLGLSRTIAMRVPFFSSAIHSLCCSDYLLVIPEHIARNLSLECSVVYAQLPLELPVQKYWLLWHPKFEHDLAHKWLRELTYNALQQSEYSIGHHFKS